MLITFDAKPLALVARRLREEATLVPFGRALDIGRVQRNYFLRKGVDDNRQLAQSTVRARKRRWGYYRKPKRGGVSSARPYGVWTGRTMRQTYGEAGGNKRVRTGFVTFQHNLKRLIRNYWDIRAIDKGIETEFDRRLQLVFDGRRRLPRRHLLGTGVA